MHRLTWSKSAWFGTTNGETDVILPQGPSRFSVSFFRSSEVRRVVIYRYRLSRSFFSMYHVTTTETGLHHDETSNDHYRSSERCRGPLWGSFSLYPLRSDLTVRPSGGSGGAFSAAHNKARADGGDLVPRPRRTVMYMVILASMCRQ